MTLTQITGYVGDSGTIPYGGSLTVTLDAPFVYEGKLLTPKPIVVPVAANGRISVALAESETVQITYRFELKNLAGETISDFHSVVPNVENADYWDLLPIPASTDLLPAGIRRLAQIITGTPELANKVTGIVPQGKYNPSTFYVQRDLVEYDGSSYLYISNQMSKGSTPHLHPELWQLIAKRGENSASGTGNDQDYSELDWRGKMDTPTRNALSKVLMDRSRPTITPWNKDLFSDYLDGAIMSFLDVKRWFAPLFNPRFTGDPQAPSKGVGDSTKSIATTEHVKQSLDYYLGDYAPTSGATFTGPVRTPTPAFTSNSTEVATTAYNNSLLRVSAGIGWNGASQPFGAGISTLRFTPVRVNQDNEYNSTTGIWLPTQSGYYRFDINVFATFSAAEWCFLSVQGPAAGSNTECTARYYVPSSGSTILLSGVALINAGTNYTIRFNTTASGTIVMQSLSIRFESPL